MSAGPNPHHGEEPDEARFAALGTTVVVLIEQPDPGAAAPDALACARAAVEHQISLVDAACSRFRPDSELTMLSQARGEPRAVSETLFAALELARRAAELTDGRVDPTVGSALEALGYDRSFSFVAPTGPAVTITIRPAPGWREIELDAATRQVRVPSGVHLDLGATAKAWCADRAADAAAAATGLGVLVSIGGDISVRGPAPDGGWPVQLSSDHAADLDPAASTVALSGGGLATSGTAVRRWDRGGRALHHVIDPSTGAPAIEWWATASVVAGCCADANIASTAAIILGAQAPEWLADRGLPARLVAPDGAVVRVGAWPDDARTAPGPADEHRVNLSC